jgi:hypothetical protein
LVLGARAVLDLLLDRPTKESLASFARMNSIVKPRSLVPADAAEDLVVAVELDLNVFVSRLTVFTC